MMPRSSQSFFDQIAASITKDHPSFKICYKNESWLMKLLALLIYPFNDRFNDGYITTLGSTVYFPNRADVELNYDSAADVLAHEGVHVFDYQRYGIRFMLSYAMNQILLLPLLIAYAVLGSGWPVILLMGGIVLGYLILAAMRWRACNLQNCRLVFFTLVACTGLGYVGLAVWLSSWWASLALAVFLPLLPVSSRLRASWEYRGYAMGIAIQYWQYGAVSDGFLNRLVPIFTGPDYYFMDRNASRVMDKLKCIRADVVTNQILLGEAAAPYLRTFSVMHSLGMVKPGITPGRG